MTRVYFDNSLEIDSKFSNYTSVTTNKTCLHESHTYTKLGSKEFDWSDDIIWRVNHAALAILATLAGVLILPIAFKDYRNLVVRPWIETVTGVEKYSIYLKYKAEEPISRQTPVQTTDSADIIATPPPARPSPPDSPSSKRAKEKTNPLDTPPQSPGAPPDFILSNVARKLVFDNDLETPLPDEVKTRARTPSRQPPPNPVTTTRVSQARSEPYNPTLTTPVRSRSRTGVPARTPQNLQTSVRQESRSTLNEDQKLRKQVQMRENEYRTMLVKTLTEIATTHCTNDYYVDVLAEIALIVDTNASTFNTELANEIVTISKKLKDNDEHLKRLKEIKDNLLK